MSEKTLKDIMSFCSKQEIIDTLVEECDERQLRDFVFGMLQKHGLRLNKELLIVTKLCTRSMEKGKREEFEALANKRNRYEAALQKTSQYMKETSGTI
ncbi:hypothetical protein ACTQ0G_12235 [Oscillospiraceae bacterium LCP21S3_A1]